MEEDDDQPCVCPSTVYRTLPGGLYLAAKNGEILKVRQYLQDGNDINAADADGYTLLSSACVGGQIAVVRFLHKQPYLHRNTRDWAGDTPLMHAAMMGHVDVVKELITRPHPCRLDLNALNNYNENASTLAISNKYVEVSEILQNVQLPQIKFECEVCLEDYDTEERRPRSLSCGHSLCTSCITETLMRGVLKCPFCRKIHMPEVRLASNVPVNFIVDSVIQGHSS
ncbi:osteoclast-stimulating factor 1 isoform X2 [Procambarus clarkii]|uniref:osteoclast-stimulating factor 1 isoform X2 n=1 Tax=Procambarus clarkii TaxID=6728 RepID=UPI001E6727B2|nr:osteoclast-stimulating factor 1-like isoform X2 [Procambarus clarkii]